MIKTFEVNIESFSDTKGFFNFTHIFVANLPDNTNVHKIYIIDNETKIRYNLNNEKHIH